MRNDTLASHYASQVVSELISLESAMRDTPCVFRRIGGIRGVISLETNTGKQLGKLWPAWYPFYHRISGEIGGAQITLISRGVFQRLYILLENDIPRLHITKQILSRACQVQDWQGQTWAVRQRGPMWNRQVVFDDPQNQGIIQFQGMNAFFKTSVSLLSEKRMPDGVSAGLAILLYYN